MSYKKATHVLPRDLLDKVQEYVDGEFLYIPRVSERKKDWGTATSTRRDQQERNAAIYADYIAGVPMEALAEKYYLSLKSIQRIVGQCKKMKSGMKSETQEQRTDGDETQRAEDACKTQK